MKVLKEGNWKTPWSKVVTCKTDGCEAELEVEEDDIKAFDYTSAYGFTCPVCGRSQTMADQEIPLRIRDARDKVRKRNTGGYRD